MIFVRPTRLENVHSMIDIIPYSSMPFTVPIGKLFAVSFSKSFAMLLD
jgi:hypothetical protein